MGSESNSKFWVLKRAELGNYVRCWRHRNLPPTPKFVLLADYRSGSTLLADLIRRHPAMHCDEEIFYRYRTTTVARVLFPYAFVRGMRAFSRCPVYGFDFKVAQVTRQGIWRGNTEAKLLRRLHAAGWKIIVLERENIVRQAISHALGYTRQMWHNRMGRNEFTRRKVVLETDFLLTCLVEHEQMAEKTKRALAELPRLHIVYERDLIPSDGKRATMKRICEFLGQEDYFEAPICQRVSSGNLADDIENFDEVLSFLRATKYAKFLDGELADCPVELKPAE